MNQFLLGVMGAAAGVAGWLLVGLYVLRSTQSRRAREAARAVSFELGSNHLMIYMAAEYGVFGKLSRSTFDRLLPELTAGLPPAELQALVIAYLGHSGYDQIARDEDLPPEMRRVALSAILEAHRVAVILTRRRVFSRREIDGLNTYADPEYTRLMQAASQRQG